MAPNRFRVKDREKREVTPFADLPEVVAERIPLEWKNVEAPPNFTWVGQDELAGMGWPKSRDQVRFLLSQGIDHLITLSADKIPPYYAFPELKWSLISVEDFTGPCIRDIKKFINEMDKARMEGEAIGVHCAEGRGRTGVMCACYLIYYHDLKPWDAIRVMRRQRPGSVERKVQEDTVVLFYQLLQDYGKESLETLEEKEKEFKDLQKVEKERAVNCENVLLMHTASFYGPFARPENKINRLERLQRIGRSRSMPKMSPEEEAAERQEIDFKKHLQNFYHDDRSRKKEKMTLKDGPQFSRAITPGRSLVINLKPMSRNLDSRENSSSAAKNDFTRHFKDFMSSNSMNLKRVRSLSQPNETGDSQLKYESNTKNSKQYEACLYLSSNLTNRDKLSKFILQPTKDDERDKNNNDSHTNIGCREKIIYKKSKTSPLFSNLNSNCNKSAESEAFRNESKFSNSIENCTKHHEITKKSYTRGAFSRESWHRIHNKYNYNKTTMYHIPRETFL